MTRESGLALLLAGVLAASGGSASAGPTEDALAAVGPAVTPSVRSFRTSGDSAASADRALPAAERCLAATAAAATAGVPGTATVAVTVPIGTGAEVMTWKFVDTGADRTFAATADEVAAFCTARARKASLDLLLGTAFHARALGELIVGVTDATTITNALQEATACFDRAAAATRHGNPSQTELVLASGTVTLGAVADTVCKPLRAAAEAASAATAAIRKALRDDRLAIYLDGASRNPIHGPGGALLTTPAQLARAKAWFELVYLVDASTCPDGKEWTMQVHVFAGMKRERVYVTTGCGKAPPKRAFVVKRG